MSAYANLIYPVGQLNRIGHSNYNFTADTYIHSGMGAHEQMALSMSERLGELLPQDIAPDPTCI